MLVVVNAKLRKGSNMYDGAYKALRDVRVEHARFLAWYPYPKLSVAELQPPDGKRTYWDFSLIDPLVFDFLNASKGHVTHIDFSTIPQWMFKTTKPVPYPADPDEIAFNYTGGSEFRDSTLKEVTDYFVRVFSWYTQGGFTDELGKYHKSGHYLKIPYWEILNEPELEHHIKPQLYTRLYDSIVTALRKLSPETKFVGMSSVDYKNPTFFEYFLNPKNHKPGVPIDMISYHFYAGGSVKQPFEHFQYSYYDRVDHFVTSVKYIESIRKRLNPNVKVTLNELGTFLTDEMRKKPIPASYWNLASAVYAYMFIELNKLGIDVISSSQLVGYPGQYPDVSMMNWENAKPNARYWTLKLINDNFGPGDKLIEPELEWNELDYAYQAFITPKGKKLLIVNKRNTNTVIKLPVDFKRAKVSTVDDISGENAAITSTLAQDNVLDMKPNAVSVLTINK
ncbi:glycosyl hydrolase family 39 [Mucilaginibacter hurinus]|uniref:Glycosyl hydrolase family 39 n=2 Tax=Mucilaginibacter hurinus TaxID=2201324 RepID=A0A367GR93_9SPHI|nr:glycosyl hydrolase family 39 [Mucilaginibacter hurinus]